MEILKNVSLGRDDLTGKGVFAKAEDFEVNPRNPHGGGRELLHVVLGLPHLCQVIHAAHTHPWTHSE